MWSWHCLCVAAVKFVCVRGVFVVSLFMVVLFCVCLVFVSLYALVALIRVSFECAVFVSSFRSAFCYLF